MNHSDWAGCSDDPETIVRDWYENYYSSVSATADGWLFHGYMHRAMERRLDDRRSFDRVLEVGGNRGEHIPFVKHPYSEYLLSDLRPPLLTGQLRDDKRISTQTFDVAQVPHPSESFDRVIATCLMHHVESPFRAAREMRRVAKIGAVITILLPTDPGLAYRVGRALSSGRAAKRLGLSAHHRLIGALDHRNHFLSIKAQLDHVFRADDVSISWFPWRVPSMSANAFSVYHVTKSEA